MFRNILTAASIVVMCIVFSTLAFAGDKNSSTSTSISQNFNQNSINNSIKDRAQAPGFGVGGGYCSDAFSASGPGFGFGFSAMSKVCKQEKVLGMADQYYGRSAARQVGCESVKEFRSLPACVAARIAKSRSVQLRDRKNAK